MRRRSRAGIRRAGPVAAGIALGVAMLAFPTGAGAASDAPRGIPVGRRLHASSLRAPVELSPYWVRRTSCWKAWNPLGLPSGPATIVGYGGDGGDANRAKGGASAAFAVAAHLEPTAFSHGRPGCVGRSTVAGQGGRGRGGPPDGGDGGHGKIGLYGAGGGGATRLSIILPGGGVPVEVVAAGGGGAGSGGPAGAGGDADANGAGGTRAGRSNGAPGLPDGTAGTNLIGGTGGQRFQDTVTYGAGGGGAGIPGGGGGGSSLIASLRAAGGGGGGSSAIGPFPSGFTATFGGRGNGLRTDGELLLYTAKPPVGGPYWPNWDIVRGVATGPRSGGYVLDGFGGLHRFSQGVDPKPPNARNGPYWSGIDIARGVAVLPDGTGGFIVDAFGGLHGFSLGAHAKPVAAAGPYWPGQDLARGLSILPDGSGGYVIDRYGGIHGFGINGHGAPPVLLMPNYGSLDIVRGLSSPFLDNGRPGGWIGLSTGEVVPWGSMFGGAVEPAIDAPDFPTRLGRGMASFDGALGGVVVDAFGGLHVFATPALP